MTMPRDITLAPGEQAVELREFRLSNVAPFYRVKFGLTTDRLFGRRPRTLLAYIPVGTERVSYPLPNIAGVRVSTYFSLAWFLLAAIFILWGIGITNLVLIVIGLLCCLGIVQAHFLIENSGGGKIYHRMAIYDRARVAEFAETVNRVIAGQVEATRRAPDVPGDPAARLAQLARLRDQGLITPEEYSAKRSEVLSRL